MIPVQSFHNDEPNLKIIKRKVPNLKEISEKFFGKDMEVQTGILLNYHSKEIQAVVNTQEVSITAKPREKAK